MKNIIAWIIIIGCFYVMCDSFYKLGKGGE